MFSPPHDLFTCMYRIHIHMCLCAATTVSLIYCNNTILRILILEKLLHSANQPVHIETCRPYTYPRLVEWPDRITHLPKADVC